MALKILLPGVPDFYQGCELWSYSFVDPDNRRPVDFSARATALDSVLAAADWHELVRAWPDGRIKLALMCRLLRLRRELPHVFAQGEYEPLAVSGRDAKHVIAFARYSGRDAVIAVIARWFANMTDDGRRWPKADDWDGVLSLPGYSAIEQNGTARRQADLSLAHLFNPIPVAIIQAVRHVV
jgi:(1->4)-alpha-D-glucan 1-alpha-D-glucosylmutase